VVSHARLHAELIAFLRQHCPARDQRHLVLLGWMVAGLLLSQMVCFDHWKTRLPLGHGLASSWQRRYKQHAPRPSVMTVVPAATWFWAKLEMALVVNPLTRLIRIRIGRLFSLNSMAATKGTLFSDPQQA
jgi:hypothetical protein